MNHIDKHDNLDDLLIKSGDYLMKRVVQYREQPVVAPVHRSASPRMRRVLVGTAAAATLTVTAVAGSFIGGTSSGKVDVAKAAWSAEPKDATIAQIEDIKSSCAVDETYISGLEGGTFDNFPQVLLEPALVESRGTTVLAMYFTPHFGIMCVQFADRSVVKSGIAMNWQRELWREPFALEFHLNNGKTVGTMVVGFLPGSGPILPLSDDEKKIPASEWVVTIDSPGVGRVSASVHQRLKRFVAWMPGSVSGEVSFVDTATGEEHTNIYFDEPKYTKWNISPVTTIVGRPND